MKFGDFQQGRRCPECYQKGRMIQNEKIIEKLNFCEYLRENNKKEIEVRCAYCGDWHVPKRRILIDRMRYIEGEIKCESRSYCSEKCKSSCPIFNKQLYPEGYSPASSREVQPELRQMVFKRDNYSCQKCGLHKDELDISLHCHHIYPLNESPITSADIDECETLCVSCHKWKHQNIPGCGYGELKCRY